MKKYALLFIATLTLSLNSKAQDGFENILLADKNDATKLMQGYFAPAMEGFIYSMNNGWFHTAKVHKVLGFDLTIGLSAAKVPTERELFNLTALGLTSISGASSASTFAGPSNSTSLTVTRNVTINDPASPANGQSQNVTANLTLPGGVVGDLPLKAVPAPLVQFNIGLPGKFEASVRYFPETDLGDDGGKAGMYGLGLKKEITDWFGPLGKTPLHVSLLAAYTSMDVSYGIPNQTGDITINNAKAEFNLSAYTIQAIASLNFPFINIYGGLGYGSGNSSLVMSGTYEGNYSYNIAGTSYTEKIDLSPPSNMEFDASGFKTTVGARLSLGFFKIFADYTLQEYNTISAGIAISIR
ncbi:hypothetical protein OD91_2189 [Lutibacter sp. Hel_I_33_5]|uniref:DUF6588 family protein n=1 Tax=Lutibacter sp. Hel_I_33_5 TaxID=1566289 RepID=UPI0011AB2C6E|nr:DUF6588 family protein [Lutibacter sp. Hel_I_33_5]TVZ56887.1 hypothetical protein OD91_2189 [Lutibacter sp. Hel_I_33_5]